MTKKANPKLAPSVRKARVLKGSPLPKLLEKTGAATLLTLPQYEVSYGPEGAQGWLSYLIDIRVHAALERSLTTRPKKIFLGSARSLCETLGIRKEVSVEQVLQALREMTHPMVTMTMPAGVGNATRHVRRYEFELSGTEPSSITISVYESYLHYLGDFDVRPLDPAYRQHLPTVAQSLYEWLSYRLYAAALGGENTAAFGYSDFCDYASLSRQNTLEDVQFQMKALQQPLFDSGYLADVEYELLPTARGLANWKLIYRAGQAARREFRDFRARRICVMAPDPDLYIAR